jgi:hypothetical protein
LCGHVQLNYPLGFQYFSRIVFDKTYHAYFQVLRERDVEFFIYFTCGTQPIFVYPYRLSRPVQEELKSLGRYFLKVFFILMFTLGAAGFFTAKIGGSGECVVIPFS